MEILKVENLTKVYGEGENLVKALDDVSFSVEKGEFVAIIGPSGSGKSTLLHSLGGVDAPSRGHVYLDGQDVYAQNEEQLSGGQQQRVSIGRALMTAPGVVLADEPTGNLDSKNSHEIIELLKHSNKKYNQTLIVITHDENIALQADRIIAIEDGKITRDEVNK